MWGPGTTGEPMKKLVLILCLSFWGDVTNAAPTEADGRSLDNRWLVILGALDGGKLPTKWENTAVKLEKAGIRPESTWSSYFKGLMPCWNIIIAGSYASEPEAKAESKRLKKAGINNYFKHAGNFVGKDARVETACRESATSAEKNIGVYPAIQWGGKALIPVSAPAAILERALEKSGTDSPVNPRKTAWIRSLIPISVGGLAVGQAIAVTRLNLSKSESLCKVKRFVALTWGSPHFSWEQNATEATAPGCGSPQVMAELDCALGRDGDVGIGFEPSQKFRLLPLPKETRSIMTLSDEFVAHDGTIVDVRARGHGYAAKVGNTLVSELNAHEIDGVDYVVQHLNFYTGEGMTECGGEDFNETVSVVVKKFRPVTRVFESTFLSIHGVVEHGADYYFLSTGSGGNLMLHSASMETFGSISKGFCDCGC